MLFNCISIEGMHNLSLILLKSLETLLLELHYHISFGYQIINILLPNWKVGPFALITVTFKVYILKVYIQGLHSRSTFKVYIQGLMELVTEHLTWKQSVLPVQILNVALWLVMYSKMSWDGLVPIGDFQLYTLAIGIMANIFGWGGSKCFLCLQLVLFLVPSSCKVHEAEMFCWVTHCARHVWPMPGFINCARVTGKWRLLHIHETLARWLAMI